MSDLTSLLAGGIPLLVVIFGLVEFVKSFGVKGQALTAVSAFFGFIFGMAYKISQSGLPVDFSSWFVTIVFGIALGLVASGFYDFADSRFPKIGP